MFMKVFCLSRPWCLIEMVTQTVLRTFGVILLFDLFKVFYKIESRHKSDLLNPKRQIFLHACVTSSEIPSNIGTII